MKCLIFDIWGTYGHFRKAYTTTSPLTYSIPTRTALSGLIAAILGLERDSYYELLNTENSLFAVRIINPIKKIRLNLNIIKTDIGFFLQDISGSPRAPTPYELIKDPHYRIYCWLKDEEAYKKLEVNLKQHLCTFTLYFGISELIANFAYIDALDMALKEAIKPEFIHSVVIKDGLEVIVEENKRYASEIIPIEMDSQRKVLKYSNIIYETSGKPLLIKEGKFYEVGNENVAFF
ncbi:MAG: type I-B CRISPR-associated protein Cas5b [Candidatus Hodarchaeota archaeon]